MSSGSARSLTLALAVSAAATAAPALPAAASGTPASAPVRASVHLYLPDAYIVLHHPVTVPRHRVHVTGVITPYLPGQKVAVGVRLGGRLIHYAWVRIRPSRGGHSGRFSEGFSSPAAGELKVIVRHLANPEMQAFRAIRRLSALDDRIGFGSTGRLVVLIQRRLSALHFFIPQTGVYDTGTGWALDAYHRLLHWGTYQSVDGRTITWLLNGWGAFHVRYPGHGRHAEANLSLQLVALIDGSRVVWMIPASSGKPSTPTVTGDFRIYQRGPGYNQKGMYYSDYFYGNYAIHGYDPVPDYPASHGCIRIPIPDAIPAYNWLAMGDWVDVYS